MKNKVFHKIGIFSTSIPEFSTEIKEKINILSG